MISSATLFLATLVFHAAAVLGAPISLSTAEIAPRSLDNSASVRFARDASFPESFPAIVERAVVGSFPIIARETEDIVRRYPRRFIHEHLEKRGTTIHEKVTVTEKTIKHDNPIDTVSYNNGHPQNKCGCTGKPCDSNANGNGNGNGNSSNGNSDSGGFTTTIAFSTTIHIPGAPTPTATTTPAAPTPTAAAPGSPTPPVPGNTNSPNPAGCPAQPGAANCPSPDATSPTTTTSASGNGPSAPANSPKPDGTTTDGPKPDGANGAGGSQPDNTTPNGSNDPAAGAKPTDGANADPAAPTPAAPAPDASGANGGEGTQGKEGSTESRRRGLKVEAPNQPIAKRNLAYSGAAWASSLRRRAL